jgi:hypothetical protein
MGIAAVQFVKSDLGTAATRSNGQILEAVFGRRRHLVAPPGLRIRAALRAETPSQFSPASTNSTDAASLEAAVLTNEPAQGRQLS